MITSRRLLLVLLAVLTSLATLPEDWSRISASNNIWVPGGPYGGNIRSIAIDPFDQNNLYSVHNSRVYKSTDGSNSWNSTSLAASVSFLAIDVINPTTVYAAGSGVHKSTDGGGSWALTSLSSSIAALVVDPFNTNTIYAGSGGSVYKSTDGGANWTPYNSGLASGVSALSMSANDSATLYAIAGGNVYKSVDAGVNWALTSGLPPQKTQALAVDPTNSNTVYAGSVYSCAGGCDVGGIYKSTDGGASWINRGYQYNYTFFAITVAPSNPNTIYVSAYYGPAKSTDGGLSWTGLSINASGTTNGFAISPNNANTVYAGTAGNGLFKSTNGGASWSLKSNGMTPISVNKIAFNPGSPKPIFISAGGVAYKSTDSGMSWNQIDTGTTPVHSLAVDPTNANVVYAGGNYGPYLAGVRKSSDAGGTWTLIALPYNNVISIAIAQSNPATIYVGVAGGGTNDRTAFKSTDGGATWTWIGEGLPNAAVAIAVDPNNASVVYAGMQSQGMYKSTDGGTSWSAGTGIASALSLVIDPTSPTTIYAAGGSIYRSTDAGASWAAINNGPTGSAISVVVDPSNHNFLYAGTSNTGAFRSTDAGATWTGFNAGLTALNIRGLVIDETGAQLHAATDQGVFNMAVVNNQPPVAICHDVAVPADSGCMTIPGQFGTLIDNGSFDPDGDPIQISYSPPGPYPLGSTQVTLTVTDSKGASSQCSATVNVFDGTPPTFLDFPANITRSTDPNNCSAVVNYDMPSASDDCSGIREVACSPTPGSTFFKGTTSVTCSVTDGAGNRTSAQFLVTVTDNEAPVMNGCANLNANTSSDSCNAVVSYPTITVTDNCDGNRTVTCIPPTGSAFNKGTTEVSCSAGDTSNNIRTCTFTMTVTDNVAPEFSGCTNRSSNTESDTCSAVVTYPTPTATDNCDGSRSVTCSPPSGAAFNKGVTTVTCSASDTSTNTGTCTFTVTVNDNVAPVLSGCTNVSANTATGQCAGVVNYPSITASDNCDGSRSVTCTPPTGSTFSKGTSAVTCTANDASGNTGSCTFTVTVNDTERPQITCPASVTMPADPGRCSAVVRYSAAATDNCADVTVVTSPASGSVFPKGTTTVTATATDTSGNQTTCTFTVTVVDSQPPTIHCPANITTSTDPNQCSSVVTYVVPTATDNCSILGVKCSPPPGSTFPVGTTTVTCTATDSAKLNSACSFTVTVNAPQLTALGPAKVWIGLKNSDDVGTKFDLLAEVLRNGVVIGSGQVNDVPGGSSGFNNAILDTINLALSSPSDFCPGNTLSFRLSVRVAASSSHVSGTARLWLNDAAANSRFNATVGGSAGDYFLVDGFLLSSSAGSGPKKTIDVLVNRNVGGNPFKPFGTWAKAF